MQAKNNSRAKIISKITDYVNIVDIIIFAYIFGSFGRGEAFCDIDIGIYLKDNLDKSAMEIEFEMEDKIQELTNYPVDARILNNAPITFVFQVIKDGVLIKDEGPDIRSDFEGLIFKKINDLVRFRNEYLKEIANAPI